MVPDIEGFRLFVAVVLAALVAVRFYDRESSANEQEHIAWLAVATFVAGYIAYKWVVIVCMGIAVVAVALGVVPALLQLFLSERVLRPTRDQFGFGAKQKSAKQAGPLIRDLREALKTGDTKLAEETLKWWEEKNAKG